MPVDTISSLRLDTAGPPSRVDETLCPFVELPGIAVLGIDTARSRDLLPHAAGSDVCPRHLAGETFHATDPRQYKWQNGRWAMAKATEAAH